MVYFGRVFSLPTPDGPHLPTPDGPHLPTSDEGVTATNFGRDFSLPTYYLRALYQLRTTLHCDQLRTTLIYQLRTTLIYQLRTTLIYQLSTCVHFTMLRHACSLISLPNPYLDFHQPYPTLPSTPTLHFPTLPLHFPTLPPIYTLYTPSIHSLHILYTLYITHTTHIQHPRHTAVPELHLYAQTSINI